MAANTTNTIYPSNEGSNILHSLVRNGTIDADCSDYIKCATDPFHDFPVSPKGIPDGKATQSVVKCVQKSLNVSAPVGAVGTYSMLVHTSPINWVDPTWAGFGEFGQLDTDEVYTSGSSAEDFGCISVTTHQSNPFSLSPTWSAVNAGRQSLSYAQEVTGKHRIIGMGFEVTNTTPQLYKGGNITVCRRMMNDPKTSTVYIGAVTTPRASEVYSGLPNSQEAMIRVPGSKQWGAEHGAYVVATKSSNEFYGPQGAIHFPILTADGIPGPTTFAPVNIIASSNGARWARTGLDYSGVLASGLSLESTFTVTMRVFVEYLPDTMSSDLDFLTPTPKYDVQAMELVNHIARAMPPGCHVEDNEGGDWFRAVSKNIRLAARIVFPVTAPFLKLSKPFLDQGTEYLAKKLDKLSVEKAKKKTAKPAAAKKKNKRAPPRKK